MGVEHDQLASIPGTTLDPAEFERRVGPDVEGWFQPVDVRAFRAIDEVQGSLGTSGDMLEIGAFAGRSAILLGSLLRRGEQLIVNDLWDDLPFERDHWDCIEQPAGRRAFEEHYLRHHPRLPIILAGSSTTALDEAVADASCRVVHVDGSHEHEIVSIDVATARRVGAPGAVLIFDDHMNPRHPGVTAAVWGAVDRGDLVPIALSQAKLYAVEAGTSFPLDRLEHAARSVGLAVSRRRCCGHDTLRFAVPPRRGAAWVPPALRPALRSMRRVVASRLRS